MTDNGLSIHNLAKQIADHMPQDWQYSPDESTEHYYAILHDGDRGIRLRIQDQRLVVTGMWPMPVQGPKYNHLFDPHNHGLDAPRITCNPNRDPGDLARDIERRFLPDYGQQYAEMVRKREEKLAELARLKEILAMFEQAGVSSVDGCKAYFRHRDGDLPSGHVEVAINSDGERAHLDVRSLPLDVALWIVSEIADCRARIIQARQEETT